MINCGLVENEIGRSSAEIRVKHLMSRHFENMPAVREKGAGRLYWQVRSQKSTGWLVGA